MVDDKILFEIKDFYNDIIDLGSCKFKLNIPIHYQLIKSGIDGAMYNYKGLTVIWSIDKEFDNKHWLHVSFSRKSRIPDYQDIKIIKKDFIGEDGKAIMVFPDKDHHINIHEFCLHLWHCIDGDSLPDFTKGKNSI